MKCHIHHNKKAPTKNRKYYYTSKANALILQTSSERLKLTIQTYQMRHKELKKETKINNSNLSNEKQRT